MNGAVAEEIGVGGVVMSVRIVPVKLAVLEPLPTLLNRVIVRPEGAEETSRGYRVSRNRRLDWEKQATVAERSFSENGFFVLVGGKQLHDLDAELDLGVDTDVCFVRLVPLVGG